MSQFSTINFRQKKSDVFFETFFLPFAVNKDIAFLFAVDINFEPKFNDLRNFSFALNAFHCQNRLIKIITDTDPLIMDNKITLREAITLAQTVLTTLQYNHTLLNGWSMQ